MRCRICGNQDLIDILALGAIANSGHFPASRKEACSIKNLILQKCNNNDSNNYCGLVQLKETLEPEEMYGENYGYRSGLNPSMVDHLQKSAKKISDIVRSSSGAVLDIGCNDGTLLKEFQKSGYKIYGIDPSAEKFSRFHPEGMKFIADFFSVENAKKLLGEVKPNIITSFSMLYDLEKPQEFVNGVSSLMDKESIWATEQSYLPSMIETLSYDTICHEHILYLSLHQLDWMAKRGKLKIIDVEKTPTNGGSIMAYFAREDSTYPVSTNVEHMLKQEKNEGYCGLEKIEEFSQRAFKHKEEVREFIEKELKKGKRFAGLGASTKGNTTLQFLSLDHMILTEIGEVNEDKFGKFTPKTNIPIKDEALTLNSNFDYYIVLPWHFREYFITAEKYKGINLVFLHPKLEVIKKA